MNEPRKVYRFVVSLSEFWPITKIWTTMDLELCPRIGEAILDFQNENSVQAYRVVEVVHWSSSKANDFAGMLIVERLGDNPHWRKVEETVRSEQIAGDSSQTAVR